VRGALLLVATVATAVAAVFAVQRLDLSFDDLRLGPLLLAALLLTPATILTNAAELRATAMASGATLEQVGWVRALRTVVLATAANLLPVPAGAILRVQVLRDAGAKLGAAAGVQLSAAAAWVGVSVVLAGGVLAFVRPADTDPLLGFAAMAGGAVVVAIGLIGVRRTATTRPGAAAGWLLVVELATAAVAALRLWLVLLGLGVAASLGQAVVIATASPIAAAAGFFPGGVGLAELLSAIVAPLAGLAAAAGLLAVAVGRVLGLLVTVPIAFTLGLSDLVRRTRDQRIDDASQP
jgi:hypothetical protein